MAASWLHLLRVNPALHPPERPSYTHTPKPGFGGRGHEEVETTRIMATHDLHYCIPGTVVNCQATHQSRSRMTSTVQSTHIFSKAYSWRDVEFVGGNVVYRYSHSFPLQPSPSVFREIPSTGLRESLLAIEIHVKVCGFQATYRTHNRRRFTPAELPY